MVTPVRPARGKRPAWAFPKGGGTVTVTGHREDRGRSRVDWSTEAEAQDA